MLIAWVTLVVGCYEDKEDGDQQVCRSGIGWAFACVACPGAPGFRFAQHPGTFGTSWHPGAGVSLRSALPHGGGGIRLSKNPSAWGRKALKAEGHLRCDVLRKVPLHIGAVLRVWRAGMQRGGSGFADFRGKVRGRGQKSGKIAVSRAAWWRAKSGARGKIDSPPGEYALRARSFRCEDGQHG